MVANQLDSIHTQPYKLKSGNVLLHRPVNHTSKRSCVVRSQASPEGTASVSTQPNPDQKEKLELKITLERSIADVGREQWEACHDGSNPFLSYDFLLAVEESGSAVPEQGWLPQHMIISTSTSLTPLAVTPLYLKMHSYGEYVFDQSWAQVHDRYTKGPSYYPKLQACVPFTPATGPRVLVKPGQHAEDVGIAAGRALMQVAEELGVSGVHVTFNTEEEAKVLEGNGFMTRLGLQYHWLNGTGKEASSLYTSFDDFLATLEQKKRKSIRQERKKVHAQGYKIKQYSGADLQNPKLWDSFYRFYVDTVDRRWGTPYLTRAFFEALSSDALCHKVLLAVAEDPVDGQPVAAALNLIGKDTLFGRNWGCRPGLADSPEMRGMHFELCYYQAIDYAIENKLKKVEAGAQGEHKIQRGYLPRITYSAHYLTNPGFASTVEDFLREERREIRRTVNIMTREMSPFKIHN